MTSLRLQTLPLRRLALATFLPLAVWAAWPSTARAGDGHAPPLSLSGKVFSLTFILLSPQVRFLALTPIEPQASPLVVLPRQFL